MSKDPSVPPTMPPPSAYVHTSEREIHIAAAARATTAMRPLPPLNGRPRIVMEADAIGWTDLSAGARALVDRLDAKVTVLDLAEGTDAAVDAIFEAFIELETAGVIVFDVG